eukprot:Skav235704  [mRNA]  locus=scaffold280:327233:328582:- [translate_table: standard]
MVSPPAFDGVADIEADVETRAETTDSIEGKSDTNPPKDAEMGIDIPAETEEPAPTRIMLLVMLSMFQGYASMVGPLQFAYKDEVGAIERGTPQALAFTQAAVGVHYGKMIARLGHNIIFACLSPRTRVLIAMVLMFVGVMIPALLVFTFNWDWVYSVFFAYILSGLGLGIFEVTFLSVITPLGRATKSWAIIGAPAGFATINILGLTLKSFGMPAVCIFWYIVACLPIGFYIFWRYAPHEKTELKTANFGASLRQCGQWMPKMIPFFAAQFLSHFAMENWPAIFYMFEEDQVPLFDPHSGQRDHLMDKNLFFAVTYIFIFLGDSISRRIAIYISTPSLNKRLACLGAAVVLIILGLFVESRAVAILIPLAIFMVFWGNGTIYGLTAHHVDKHVPSEHNLASYSFWCFIGDLGAIIGGILVDNTHDLFCEGHHGPFECVTTAPPTILGAA